MCVFTEGEDRVYTDLKHRDHPASECVWLDEKSVLPAQDPKAA